MKTPRTVTLCMALVCTLLAASSCRSKRPTLAETVALPVAEAVHANVPVRRQFVGQIYGYNDITLMARVDGYLRSIHFKEGSFIKKGTLLYRIETAPYAAQTEQSRAAVTQAEAQLLDTRQTYQRTKALFAIHAASQSDLDNATAQYSTAQASLKAARAQLTSAQIEQGYTQIYAPVDGIIGRTLAQVGDFVGLNSQHAQLNTISQVDSIKVRFYMPEETYTTLEADGGRFKEITLLLADNSVYPQQGRFNFIGRAIESSTGSIDVQVSFDNPDTLLRPGQFARISAVMDTLYNATVIPQQAVNQTQNTYSVYVLASNGSVSQRIITVGTSYGHHWVVNSGLRPGERIITEGFHKLHSGVKVRPANDTTAQSSSVASQSAHSENSHKN